MATKKSPKKITAKKPSKAAKKPAAKKAAAKKPAVKKPSVKKAPTAVVVEDVVVAEAGPFILRTWMDGSPADFAFDTRSERDALHTELCSIVAAGQTKAIKVVKTPRKERMYVKINKIHDPA